MNVSFTLVSGNRKVGPIPTSMTSSESCPSSCPFMKCGCYAKAGPTLWHWQKLNKGLHALVWDAFCAVIKRLPRGQLWRHNVAGDLPSHNGDNETIDSNALSKLVAANHGKNGFTYTHKHNRAANLPLIRHANDNGFTVNLSANNLSHADKLAETKAGPVCVVLPSVIDGNVIRTLLTPAGRKVVVCPATYREGVTCSNCKLCSRADRTCIVGFPSHGTSYKKVDRIAAPDNLTVAGIA